jgi:hypothetical protein
MKANRTVVNSVASAVLITALSWVLAVGGGVGHGTGDLQGMTIKYTFDLAAGPSDCNPDGPKGHVHGIILSPAS